MGAPIVLSEVRFRCPGCDRVIDASGLRAGERFKCAKCKKLMIFGPHLFDPSHAPWWRRVRLAVILVCLGATVWCLTVGYDFAHVTDRWTLGLGGSIVVWGLVAGAIALAARTTQNLWVVAGVATMMVGAALFSMERLGARVGYPVEAWHRRPLFALWAPGLVVAGLALFAAALVVQSHRRSL